VEKRMKKAPIKAKNESNSPLFASFLTQSGVFCNFFTRSTGCAKVSIINRDDIELKHIKWFREYAGNKRIRNIAKQMTSSKKFNKHFK
jgi:hypothetical protein